MGAGEPDGPFDGAVCGRGGAVVFHADGAALVFFCEYASADARELVEEFLGHGGGCVVEGREGNVFSVGRRCFVGSTSMMKKGTWSRIKSPSLRNVSNAHRKVLKVNHSLCSDLQFSTLARENPTQ